MKSSRKAHTSIARGFGHVSFPAVFAAVALAFAALGCLSVAHANPWLAPGAPGLRHDIQLLADAGVIRAPTMTWPMSWPDIARDVLNAEPAGDYGRAVEDALLRVQHVARREATPGFGRARIGIAGAREPTRLRTFSDTPREEAGLEIGASWLGGRTAANLNVAWAANPEDEKEIRLDGSYVGITLANFMISAGAMERWWGPGWEGSLLLSTNARPIPGITVERNYTDPFRWKLLRWLGPWRASVAMGQEEGSDVAVPDTRFFAARLNFRPASWLELGLSRTAQWCGEGRPCDASTFWDLLVGRDNRDGSLTPEDEPGNQMAGYDLRVRSPWMRLPLSLYAQAIGEDEAGGLPSKFLGLMGLEIWGAVGAGSYRIHMEYADTACSFSRRNPEFDCAYRNALYPQGFVYRGRVIGHALDNDGRMASAGVLLVRRSGETWSVVARRVELNRAGAAPDLVHTTSASPDKLENAEVQYNRAFAWGELQLGAGYDSYNGPAREGSETRGFIRWRQGF